MDDKQEATKMFIAGIDPVDIAAELGTTLAQVHHWIINTEVLAELRTQRNEAIIETYKDASRSIGSICKEFSVSQGTVYRVLHRADVPMRRIRQGTAQAVELNKLVVKMYGAGATIQRIRVATGYSLNRIYEVVDDAELPRRRLW